MAADSAVLKKSSLQICKRCEKFPVYVTRESSEYCIECLPVVANEQKDAYMAAHPEESMHGFPKRFMDWEKDALLPHYQKLLDRNISSPGLYLEGIQGSGKTCFITVFGREYVKQFRQDIWFVNSVALMYEVKGTFDKDSKIFNDYDVIMRYAKKPVLVIDDIGSEKASEYVRQSFYALINHRYLENLKTFITSFYSLEQLAARYDASIASRIAEMCEVVDMGNTDLRLQRRTRK